MNVAAFSTRISNYVVSASYDSARKILYLNILFKVSGTANPMKLELLSGLPEACTSGKVTIISLGSANVKTYATMNSDKEIVAYQGIADGDYMMIGVLYA